MKKPKLPKWSDDDDHLRPLVPTVPGGPRKPKPRPTLPPIRKREPEKTR